MQSAVPRLRATVNIGVHSINHLVSDIVIISQLTPAINKSVAQANVCKREVRKVTSVRKELVDYH